MDVASKDRNVTGHGMTKKPARSDTIPSIIKYITVEKNKLFCIHFKACHYIFDAPNRILRICIMLHDLKISLLLVTIEETQNGGTHFSQQHLNGRHKHKNDTGCGPTKL